MTASGQGQEPRRRPSDATTRRAGGVHDPRVWLRAAAVSRQLDRAVEYDDYVGVEQDLRPSAAPAGTERFGGSSRTRVGDKPERGVRVD